MTRPRSEIISVEHTPYYHIYTRCVRRAFLAGNDKMSGKNYEYRRQWIEDLIRLLASIFSLEVCSYAIMSNHYHIVVKLCPSAFDDLTDRKIVSRWACLHKPHILVDRWMRGEISCPVQTETVQSIIDQYRQRLTGISWFMKTLNQNIACKANEEDKCKGHFWESRYKSQPLPNEEALITAMAYTDLNPVRAGMAKTPESSDHTSIKERIKPSFNYENAKHVQIERQSILKCPYKLKPLLKFEGNVTGRFQDGILFNYHDYLQIIDITARIIHPKKKGRIPNELPPILERLNTDLDTWVENTTEFEKHYLSRLRYQGEQYTNTA